MSYILDINRVRVLCLVFVLELVLHSSRETFFFISKRHIVVFISLRFIVLIKKRNESKQYSKDKYLSSWNMVPIFDFSKRVKEKKRKGFDFFTLGLWCQFVRNGGGQHSEVSRS